MTLDDLGDRLFVSAPEAAVILGRDVRTIRHAAEAGEIPASKAGAKWLIPTSWIRQQAGMPTAAGSDVDYDRLAELVAPRVARELYAHLARLFSGSPGEAI
jgi:excisionase family DNA binding protein